MTADRPRQRIGLLFQIYRTHLLSSRLVGRALEPTGVRGDDYAAYSYLLHGPMTLTELAEGVGMPLTTAAGYVRRFDGRGHIVKTPNPADGRSKLLSLTEDCRAWVLETARIFTKTVDHLDAIMAGNGIDAAELIDQLELVQELMNAALEELRVSDFE